MLGYDVFIAGNVHTLDAPVVKTYFLLYIYVAAGTHVADGATLLSV